MPPGQHYLPHAGMVHTPLVLPLHLHAELPPHHLNATTRGSPAHVVLCLPGRDGIMFERESEVHQGHELGDRGDRRGPWSAMQDDLDRGPERFDADF